MLDQYGKVMFLAGKKGSMADIPTIKPQQEVQYSVVQLKELLELTQHLTGEMPTKLKVSSSFYNFYVEESERIAKTFGIELKRSKKPTITFNGVKIVK